MSYGIIRAKFVKQYESTRYDFRFCKSVKFLYSECKETLQCTKQVVHPHLRLHDATMGVLPDTKGGNHYQLQCFS